MTTAIANAPSDERLLRETQVAAMLGCSPRTLQDLRIRGAGPRFLKLSGRWVRYRPADIRAWIETKVRTSTSDDGSAAADR